VKIINYFFGIEPTHAYYEGNNLEFGYISVADMTDLSRDMIVQNTKKDTDVVVMFDAHVKADAKVLFISIINEEINKDGGMTQKETRIFTTDSIVYLMNDLGSTVDSFKTR